MHYLVRVWYSENRSFIGQVMRRLISPVRYGVGIMEYIQLSVMMVVVTVTVYWFGMIILRLCCRLVLFLISLFLKPKAKPTPLAELYNSYPAGAERDAKGKRILHNSFKKAYRAWVKKYKWEEMGLASEEEEEKMWGYVEGEYATSEIFELFVAGDLTTSVALYIQPRFEGEEDLGAPVVAEDNGTDEVKVEAM